MIFDEKDKIVFETNCSFRKRGSVSHEIYNFTCNISYRNVCKNNKFYKICSKLFREM